MRRRALFLLAILAFAVQAATSGAAEPSKPKFPINQETTRVTSPLDAQGYVDYPAALNEIYSRGVTPQNNANVDVWQVLGPLKLRASLRENFQALGIEPPPADGDYFVSYYDVLEVDEFTVFENPRPWVASSHPNVARWLKACEPHLAAVAEGLKRPEFYGPIVVKRSGNGRETLNVGSILNEQKLYGITAAFTARAMLHLGEGRSDQAWNDILSTFRLARLSARAASNSWMDRIFSEHLSLLAAAVYLNEASHTADEWLARARQYEALPAFPPSSEMFDRFERFTCLDLLQSLDRGDPLVVRGLTLLNGEPDPKSVARFAGLDYEPALREINAGFDRLVSAAAIADRRERSALLAQLAEETRRNDPEFERRLIPRPLRLPIAPVTPDLTTGRAIGRRLFSNAFYAAERSLQQCDVSAQLAINFRIALALSAYRAKHGRYPANLSDLPPTPAVNVDDLFSDKPLIYRRLDDGFLLYSVGPNGRDDDGRRERDDPTGKCDDLPMRVVRKRPAP